MKVLSNLEFKNSTYILNKFEDFPENPVEGMTIFKENGLYIYSTNITSGNLEWLNILDFTRVNSSFKFEQSNENIEWNITHNLNTQDLFVIVYDSEGNKQVESEIQFQSDNEIKLIFSEPISGKALLFGASVISSPSNIYTKEEIDELLKNIEVSGGGSNIILPENGVDGYLLSKSGDELGWTNPADVGTKLPENGLNGQVLSINNGDLTWSNPKAPVKLNVGDLVYTFNNTPPANTFLCDNSSLIDKNKYPELYSIIGDKFTNDDSIKVSNNLMVPIYEWSEQDSVVSNIESDLTLGNNSYYSGILYGNIKVTTIGPGGGIYVYTNGRPDYGWGCFNTAITTNATIPGVSQTWQTIGAGTYYLEIERLDDIKFSLYTYGIRIRNANSNYFPTSFKIEGYDDNSQSYITLDEQLGSTLKVGSFVYYKLNNYLEGYYSKIRLTIVNNGSCAIDTFELYGTREGESSIYDMFALPPSSTNESGAKACIVHSSYTIQEPSVYSEDETEIGTWIDGKPIYRKIYNGLLPNTTNTTTQIDISNISEVIKINSIIYDDTYILQVPNSTTSGDIYININIKENKINCYCTNSYWSGKQIKIILEYTKN